MTESIAIWFTEKLGGVFSCEIIVFIVSLMPILELRGGILAAYAMGMDFLPAFIVSFVGNMLPIPFILLFIQKIFGFLKKTRFKNAAYYFEKKAMAKSDIINKYAYLGVLIFVAIPLPGTGAWTGALIASMLKLDTKKALLTISIGVFIAGIIVSLISYGLLNAIGIG
ncbi:MAG: small multi-drug export protein [Lachnospiraceae bacterium]|nr:small multi-drug export protein [Lachnospiraceae bacterium]